MRTGELQEQIALLRVVPGRKPLRGTGEELGGLLETEAPDCALRSPSRPRDGFLRGDERFGGEQMMNRLGERGVRVIAISLKERPCDTLVEIGAPPRR